MSGYDNNNTSTGEYGRRNNDNASSGFHNNNNDTYGSSGIRSTGDNYGSGGDSYGRSAADVSSGRDTSERYNAGNTASGTLGGENDNFSGGRDTTSTGLGSSDVGLGRSNNDNTYQSGHVNSSYRPGGDNTTSSYNPTRDNTAGAGYGNAGRDTTTRGLAGDSSRDTGRDPTDTSYGNTGRDTSDNSYGSGGDYDVHSKNQGNQGKVSVGDKIKGTAEQLIGKATSNSEKVERGAERKTPGDNYGSNNNDF